MTRGYMTRKYEMDAGHRVMHERVKCHNFHGHRYVADLEFGYDEMHSIGYALDFKEVKRVACAYFDKRFDHGMILNPHDEDMINVCLKHGTKIHLMNLMGKGEYCNHSAENIVKELFFACTKLIDDPNNCNLHTHHIRLYETPNCWVDCYRDSLSESDWKNLEASDFARDLEAFRKEKGTLEYDVRKASEEDLKVKDLEN